MTRLYDVEELKILNNLDNIKERLHHKELNYDDSLWMVNTINALLVDRYLNKAKYEEVD